MSFCVFCRMRSMAKKFAQYFFNDWLLDKFRDVSKLRKEIFRAHSFLLNNPLIRWWKIQGYYHLPPFLPSFFSYSTSFLNYPSPLPPRLLSSSSSNSDTVFAGHNDSSCESSKNSVINHTFEKEEVKGYVRERGRERVRKRKIKGMGDKSRIGEKFVRREKEEEIDTKRWRDT